MMESHFNDFSSLPCPCALLKSTKSLVRYPNIVGSRCGKNLMEESCAILDPDIRHIRLQHSPPWTTSRLALVLYELENLVIV